MRNEKQHIVLKKIGVEIYKQRQKKNIPRTHLALELGIDEKQIRRIENGEVNPTILTLLKICYVLEFEISFLEKIKIDDGFIDI
ncbi:MAG: helix-turn-helix domain-containing protein [Bacteroidota bacterium]